MMGNCLTISHAVFSDAYTCVAEEGVTDQSGQTPHVDLVRFPVVSRPVSNVDQRRTDTLPPFWLNVRRVSSSDLLLLHKAKVHKHVAHVQARARVSTQWQRLPDLLQVTRRCCSLWNSRCNGIPGGRRHRARNVIVQTASHVRH